VKSPRRLQLVSAVALALAALDGGTARAAEMAMQLDYSVAPSCPGVDDFAAIVSGRLGYNPFRADAPGRVLVRIEPMGRALEGRLEWRGSAGERMGDHTFPSRTGDCGELARAMGFALALQMQLLARATPEPPPPPPPAPVPPPPEPPAAAVVAVPEIVTSHRDATASGPAILVGAGAAAGFGVASSVVPVGRLFVTAAWSRVAVELGGELGASSTTHQPDGSGFSQRQILGTLAGCGVRRPWSLCLVGKLGQIRVTGEGVDVPATATGPLAQTGIRLAVTHTLGGWFEVSAHADGLALLTRGTVTLDSLPVWTTSRFAALVGADVGLRFR
jgi:hypothetical protein